MSELRFRGLAAVLTLTAVAIAGCLADDDDVTDPGDGNPGDGTNIAIPTAWAGTYQMTTTEGGERVQPEIEIVRLCGGRAFADEFNDVREDGDIPFDEIACSGSWGSRQANVTCTSTRALEGDCVLTQTLVFTAARDGDAINGSVDVTRTVGAAEDGTCSESGEETDTTTFSGQRIDDDDPVACGEFEQSIPSAWVGDWDVELTDPVPCPGIPRATAQTFTLSLCQGDDAVGALFGNAPEGMEFDFSGGVTNDTAEIFVEMVDTQADCDNVTIVEIRLTRTGDDITGSFKQTVHIFGGDAPQCIPSRLCTMGFMTATRVSETPSDCGGMGGGRVVGPLVPYLNP